MALGANYDAAQQAVDTFFGQTATWVGGDVTFACTREQVPRKDVEDLVSVYDAGNPGNADIWRVMCSSASFNAGAGPFPREGDSLTWDDGGISALKVWRIVDAGAPPIAGVIGPIYYLAYRKGAPDAVTADGVGGTRPYIQMPENALAES